jgi:allantoinase
LAVDLVVRGGLLVTSDGLVAADLAVEDGKVSAVGPDLEETAVEEIDARGLHVLPGGLDAHVHFNEPGRTHWEGFETGTRALAAGGLTCYVEMPLNAYPPTCDVASFDEKLAHATESSLVDFALWGGLVPGNLEDMQGLAERGVAGFKAFMSTTGTPDFQAADELTLFEGMGKAAELGLPVLVHAENRAITDDLARRYQGSLRTKARDYLASRPVIAELEAISRAILLAEETGCSLHIVHVSTGRGVALLAEARARGVDVTCETCAHYLVFTDEDVKALGAVLKCAPPLRAREHVEELWDRVLSGDVEFVTSDHSPCPPDMKAGDDFFRAWGGLTGCQSTLNVVLDEGYHGRGLPLQRIVALVSGHVAGRFGLPGKGSIWVEADADLALVDLNARFALQTEDLLYRYKMSPYVGKTFRGRVVRTMLRGSTVFRDGRIVSRPIGKLIKPSHRREERL